MLLRLNQLHGQHVEGKSHLGLGDVRVVGPVLDPHQVVVVGEVDGPAAVQDGFGGDVVAVTVVAASTVGPFVVVQVKVVVVDVVGVIVVGVILEDAPIVPPAFAAG